MFYCDIYLLLLETYLYLYTVAMSYQYIHVQYDIIRELLTYRIALDLLIYVLQRIFMTWQKCYILSKRFLYISIPLLIVICVPYSQKDQSVHQMSNNRDYNFHIIFCYKYIDRNTSILLQVDQKIIL